VGQPRPDARQRDKGLTLIELLIVIVILGVLAGIVLFAVGAFNNRGELASCRSDVKAVEVAVEAFRANEGRYPTNLNELTGSEAYLRELPNTTPSTGVYWVTYDQSTGQVGGVLNGGNVCAGELIAAGPTATTTTTTTTTGPPGGGPGGGGTTTTTAPGGGGTTTTTTPGGGTTTTTTPPGGGPGSTGQPVLVSDNCGGFLCEVLIDWPSVSGASSYWYQNVPRSSGGNCNFGIGGSWVSGDSQETLIVFRNVAYCFRVQVIDGIISGPWSPVLVYTAN
jgi:general secretion pathway protein G